MQFENVLLINNDAAISALLSDCLKKQKLNVFQANSCTHGLDLLKSFPCHLVVADAALSDGSGFDLLEKVKKIHPKTLIAIVTNEESSSEKNSALSLGAFDCFSKPFSLDRIEELVEKAKQHSLLSNDQEIAGRSLLKNPGAHRVIGESPVMKEILQDAKQIAKSSASVFITGESGTGKEVIANFIHYNSPRKERPFICVNCAAIPDTLIESEFFGHERGAFTGASTRRLGRFEMASEGTLLLDEVSEIPTILQAKLLRAIQEHEFERVGGNKSIKVDTRLISTSNQNIKELVANKVLREDLYYRLNVIPLHLPPLRERTEDILPLAHYFLETFCIENKTEQKQLASDAKQALLAHYWPGNVRELANIIERAVVMTSSLTIHAENLRLESQACRFPPIVLT